MFRVSFVLNIRATQTLSRRECSLRKVGRGLKIEGVKILRFVDKSGKGDRKMVVLGGLQELKAYFVPSYGKY